MLLRGKRYRLIIPTIALVPTDNHQKVAITIPDGAVIKILELPPTSASVSIEWEDKVCEIFKEDLIARGHEVSDESAGDRLPF